MKNKNAGFLIVGIAIVIGIIILLFNTALTQIVSENCSHGPSCAMYGDIKTQTVLSLILVGVIFLIGVFFIFSKEHERVIVKRIKPHSPLELVPKKFDKKSLEKLNEEEKKIMNLILEHNGSIYQSKIAEFLGMNKVQVTRLLDSLEAQGLIERKRRGMTNIVLLKH